jgi:hypothetical protein
MVGSFEAKLVELYIEKNYPECKWVFYVIKDDIMTISYRDKYSEICEVVVTFNELIDNYKYGTS